MLEAAQLAVESLNGAEVAGSCIKVKANSKHYVELMHSLQYICVTSQQCDGQMLAACAVTVSLSLHNLGPLAERKWLDPCFSFLPIRRVRKCSDLQLQLEKADPSNRAIQSRHFHFIVFLHYKYPFIMTS